MIRRGEVLRWVALGVGLACLLGLGGFAWSEWKRRQKIRAARPMVSDSPAFAEALQNCKSHLPANPRSVVRFTNLSRFLYQILASSEKVPDTGWEPDFFRALCARWLGKTDPTGNALLDAEIVRWVPNDGSELDAARPIRPLGPAQRRSPSASRGA